MSATLEDQETIATVSELASRLKTTPQEAVRYAVRAELSRRNDEADFDQGLREAFAQMPKPEPTATGDEPSLEERLKSFHQRHPLPTPTGLPADKAFFDEMSGEFD